MLVLHLRLLSDVVGQIGVLKRLGDLGDLGLDLGDLVDNHLGHVHVEVGLLVRVYILVSWVAFFRSSGLNLREVCQHRI